MTPRMVRGWILLGGALAAACGGAQAGGQQVNVAKAQGHPGAAVYRRACAGCHGQDGEGVSSMPAVMGGSALPASKPGRARFDTAADVFEYVSREMPLPKAKAGSLSAEEYWAVVNFMLIGHGSALPEGGVNEANAASVSLEAAQ